MSIIELIYSLFAGYFLFSDASIFAYEQGPVANGLSCALLLPAGNGRVISREQKICSQVNCLKFLHFYESEISSFFSKIE